MTTAQWLAFLLPTLALNLTPGPDLFFVVGRATKGGPRAALEAAAGLWVGYIFHILLVTIGLASMLSRFPQALTALKLLGGAYLLFLGAKLLLQKKEKHVRQTADGNFLEGIFVSALNPKVAIFFLAFLPQFVSAGTAHPTLRLLALGFTFSLTSTAVNLGAGLSAHALGQRPRAARAPRGLLDKACGLAMVGFALRLAFAR